MKETGVRSTGKLILSPVPLAQAMREAYAGASAVFMDLATLRRGGALSTLRTLRSCDAGSVIVTGDEADLAVFGDILSLITMVVPSAERRYAPPGCAPVPLGWRDLPLVLGRIFCGITAGLEALIANTIRLRRISRKGREPRASRSVGNRCLYLKPALSFGALVGGSVGHVAGVANALYRAGKEIRLVAAAEQPLVDPEVRQVVVKPPSFMAYPHELNRFRYHRKYVREVLQQVADFHPDFIYQRYVLDDLSGIFLRCRIGIPLVLEFNGSETWAQRHWGETLSFQAVAERIEQANLRYADLVVVVSEELKKQVCSLGIPEERVLFYPNCVDSSVFDPRRFDPAAVQKVRQELGVPLKADLFTFVGTFGQWHGTEVLAAAIRRLADNERAFLEARRIHFLLVGDGHYGEKVRSILKDVPFVSLPGYRPQSETPSILAASDFCLSPHIPNPDGTPFFGSPTKLFEYMAMEKPIIASDLDQIGWVLRGWRPGDPAPSLSDRLNAAAIMVEPGNLDSLIQGIRNAAGMDCAARSRLGERGRQFVLESFTWDKNVRAVLNRLERILAPRSGTEGVLLPNNLELS
jgi:glycosyltransferase involved in cell wall biosynthesis